VSRVDVLAVIDREISCAGGVYYSDGRDLIEARAAIVEVFATAHASLAARDLADQMAADDRLRAALAACEPEAPHEPV
jgi:hypothetical protein